MNKELNSYRNTLKTQNAAYIGGFLIIIVLIVLSIVQIIEPVGNGERWAAMWNGFICGVSSAVAGFMILGIVINTRALKDEERLKKLYIREHDERAKEISHYAGHLSYWFETLGLLLGTIICGFFSPLISIVCLCCLMYICLVRFSLKLYYCKKL